MTEYKWEWVCECGKIYYDHNNASRFMNFGFHKLCNNCGRDMGDHGSAEMERVKVKYTPDPSVRFLKLSTWFRKDIREVVEK